MFRLSPYDHNFRHQPTHNTYSIDNWYPQRFFTESRKTYFLYCSKTKDVILRCNLVSAVNFVVYYYFIGPPTVLDQSTNETTDYLELIVMFMIYPFSDEPKWFLQGNEILPNAQYHINTSTVPVTLIQYETSVLVEGFRTSLIILNHKTLPDAAYTCKISNEFGEVEEVVLSRSGN